MEGVIHKQVLILQISLKRLTIIFYLFLSVLGIGIRSDLEFIAESGFRQNFRIRILFISEAGSTVDVDPVK
jgi:hypothetical protein